MLKQANPECARHQKMVSHTGFELSYVVQGLYISWFQNQRLAIYLVIDYIHVGTVGTSSLSNIYAEQYLADYYHTGPLLGKGKAGNKSLELMAFDSC